MELDDVTQNSEKMIALSSFGSGYRGKNDPAFEENNRELFKPFVRLGVYRYDDENLCHKSNPIHCNIPNCNQNFDTVFAYENHFNALHRFLCAQCSKNLPSAHLLDLHLSEKHDSFFAVLSERKPMFGCYLEECCHKSQTPTERRDHCITEHKFPHDFRFDCYNHARKINEKTKKTHQKSSTETKNKIQSSTIVQPSKLMSVAGNDEDIELENKSIVLTAQRKQFTNLRFGHRKTKTFNNHGTDYAKLLAAKQKSNEATEHSSALDNKKMVDDLMDSLPQ